MEPHICRNPNIQVVYPENYHRFFSQKKESDQPRNQFFFRTEKKWCVPKANCEKGGEIPLELGENLVKNGEDKPGILHPRKLTAGGPQNLGYRWFGKGDAF